MTIEDEHRFLDGVWDWGILRGCFGDTTIEPTDIDGFVERKGRFLVLEAKDVNAGLKLGQRITFEALRRTGLFTIIIVWGPKNEPKRIEVWSQGGTYKRNPATLDDLRAAVSWWFDRADRGDLNA